MQRRHAYASQNRGTVHRRAAGAGCSGLPPWGKVQDVTTHPALRNGVHSLAALYDMQHDAALREAMTYTSPSTGDRVGLSFITPRTRHDLERRRLMMTHWARAGCGMMGRAPDFMNVTMMAMAAASEYFAQNRPEFKDNIQRYYEYIREHDLVLTHTLVNLRRNRSPLATPLQDRTDAALAVVWETDARHCGTWCTGTGDPGAAGGRDRRVSGQEP